MSKVYEVSESDIQDTVARIHDRRDAAYIVVFTRDAEADYTEDRSDTEANIAQLAGELQEAYDICGIGGFFQIVGRYWQGEFTKAEEVTSK